MTDLKQWNGTLPPNGSHPKLLYIQPQAYSTFLCSRPSIAYEYGFTSQPHLSESSVAHQSLTLQTHVQPPTSPPIHPNPPQPMYPRICMYIYTTHLHFPNLTFYLKTEKEAIVFVSSISWRARAPSMSKFCIQGSSTHASLSFTNPPLPTYATVGCWAHSAFPSNGHLKPAWAWEELSTLHNPTNLALCTVPLLSNSYTLHIYYSPSFAFSTPSINIKHAMLCGGDLFIYLLFKFYVLWF